MKTLTKTSIALTCSFLFAAAPATAAQVFLQAGDGHAFLTNGTANWTDTFQSGVGPHGFIKIIDGRSLFVPAPSAGSRVATWVNPIPLTATNQSWTTVARGTGSSISQRICAFTSNGTFSNCGNPVSFNSASTVLVPTDGTAFSQTTLTSSFGTGDSGTLVSIRANN